MRGAVVLFSRRRRSIIALTHSRRAARTPDRPNPIGIHRVIVTAVEPAKVHVAALEASDGSKVAPSARPYCRPSGVGKTRRVGLSGAVASLVVAVSGVTRQGFGRFVFALQRLHPATPPGRQDPTRSNPLPQALSRPQPLPITRTRSAPGDL